MYLQVLKDKICKWRTSAQQWQSIKESTQTCPGPGMKTEISLYTTNLQGLNPNCCWERQDKDCNCGTVLVNIKESQLRIQRDYSKLMPIDKGKSVFPLSKTGEGVLIEELDPAALIIPGLTVCNRIIFEGWIVDKITSLLSLTNISAIEIEASQPKNEALQTSSHIKHKKLGVPELDKVNVGHDVNYAEKEGKNSEIEKADNDLHCGKIVENLCLSGFADKLALKLVKTADHLFEQAGLKRKAWIYNFEDPPPNIKKNDVTVSIRGMRWDSKADSMEILVPQVLFHKSLLYKETVKVPKGCVVSMDLKEMLDKSFHTLEKLQGLEFNRAVILRNTSSQKMNLITVGDAVEEHVKIKLLGKTY